MFFVPEGMLSEKVGMTKSCAVCGMSGSLLSFHGISFHEKCYDSLSIDEINDALDRNR